MVVLKYVASIHCIRIGKVVPYDVLFLYAQQYHATGRGFVVRHIKFSENYRLYSRSHFVKGYDFPSVS